MKKQVSTLSLIALAALSIWQYFTEHKKDTKPAPTTTQQQSQSAVKNILDFDRTFLFLLLPIASFTLNKQQSRVIIYPIKNKGINGHHHR